MLCAAVTRDGQLTVPDTRDGSLRQCVAKARGTARAASCACDSGGDEVCHGLMSFESPCLRRLLRSSRSKRPANVEDQCWGAASKQLRRNFKLNPRIHVHKTIDPTTLRRVTKLHEIYSSISVDLSWSDRDLRVNNHLVCVGRRNAAAGHPLRSQGESGPVSQAAGIDGQLVTWTK